MPSAPSFIKVGARSSPLSRAQTIEVEQELQRHHPTILLSTTFLETTGDKEQTKSLRPLGKTDFFTREIDELVQNQTCQIGIHSAKDLPEPLPPGLCLIALTKGIDSSDSLVLREGETLSSLLPNAVIGTSSERREVAVQTLRPNLAFRDIRGTIETRLSLLTKGTCDGVVIAEAALIRLGLTHLNRITLPGDTVPFQGQLAIIAREDNQEMRALFASIDSRT